MEIINIGKNLKELREIHHLTQFEFGQIAGVSDKAVSSWEVGTTEPRMGALQKLANYFGIKTTDIIDGKIYIASNNGNIINGNKSNSNDNYTTNNNFFSNCNENEKTENQNKDRFFILMDILRKMNDIEIEEVINYSNFILSRRKEK